MQCAKIVFRIDFETRHSTPVMTFGNSYERTAFVVNRNTV